MGRIFDGFSRTMIAAAAAFAAIPGAMALTVVSDTPGTLASALGGCPPTPACLCSREGILLGARCAARQHADA